MFSNLFPSQSQSAGERTNNLADVEVEVDGERKKIIFIKYD